jgi:ParB/RepB/Spo0J family partition protein
MNIETKWIGLDLIVVPADARGHDPVCLQELAADMAAEGQLQEIVVTHVNRGPFSVDRNGESEHGSRATGHVYYEVIAGAGRYQAAKSLGWKEIRCSIRENVSEFEKVRITFAENADREDVDPFYQALLLQKMIQAKGLSQRQLAEMLGKTEAYVSQYLSLLKFSAQVQKDLTRVKLSLKQLLEVVKLEGDEIQLKAAHEIAAGGLTVKQAKQAVRKHLAAQGKAPRLRKSAIAPGTEDPMAAIWGAVKALPINHVQWSVSYPGEKLWRFEIRPNAGDYAVFLAEWFENMAKAIKIYNPVLAKDTAA